MLPTMKDGQALVSAMCSDAQKLNDYSLVFETITFKKGETVSEKGNLYFKKPKLMRLEEIGDYKKNQVDESGVIKEPEVHLEIFKHFIEEFPDKYILENLIYSPIKGAKCNIEFLAHFVPSYKNAPLGVDFSKIVYDAHNQLKGKDD